MKLFCSSHVGITSCADFSWLSRLRYYWVGGDESETSESSQSQKQDTTADEDSLAIGSNVELQMLHSKYEIINTHIYAHTTKIVTINNIFTKHHFS